jgi:hypothetical protein
MSTIVLTVEESKTQIVAGFPEYVTFSTNVPATIFYTLDGSEPTDDSSIATGKVYLATDQQKITLKVFARTPSVYSETLEFEYSNAAQDIDKTRRVGEEGLNILPPCDPVVDHLSKDAFGNCVQETSIPFQDLEMVASETNSIGEPLEGGTSLSFVNFSYKKLKSDTGYHGKITNTNDSYFDPVSALIIINGSTHEDMAAQVVKVINRPYHSMDLVSNSYNESYQRADLVSANFVRSISDPKTGITVFYYFDSRECRWIKSIQQTQPKTVTLDWGENNFVFRWVQEPSASRLF